MAVDEWLMKSVGDTAVLRLYSWMGDWVSVGYFQSLTDARKIFGEGPEYVRRWTGGGIVDHRNDLTYTLVIPRSHELAGKRGSEGYTTIHREIARCLGEGGVGCDLAPDDSTNDFAACFEKPVAWDLLGDDGRKLAGTGQRLARKGALDQLPNFLSGNYEAFVPHDREVWTELISKFASAHWLERVS